MTSATLAPARATLVLARRRGRAREATVTVTLAVATALALVVSMSVGDFPIPLWDVARATVGLGDPGDAFIVQELRLPRAAAGFLVGLAFGMSGAIFQSLAANELASPDLIGITEGASTTAVFLIAVTGASGIALSGGALAGALATAALIYLLAYRSGVSGYRLILVGIGAAAALQSVTSYLLTRAHLEEVQDATVWLAGSLNGAAWGTIVPLAVAVAVLAPAALLLARGLRGLQLGDDAARGVGVRVEPARAAIVLVAVGLVGFGTAAAGPVAFVALIAAPIARRLIGSGRLALLAAGLVGALMLTVSDVISRQAFGDVELPVGILTGILGAPYLLWLLATTNRAGTGA